MRKSNALVILLSAILRHSALLSLSVAVLLICDLTSPAQAALRICPKGYYSAHASNPLRDVNSTIDYTVCVLFTTHPREIDLAAHAYIEATNAEALQLALIKEFVGKNECTFASIGGWDILSLELRFRGTGSASVIKIKGGARSCLPFSSFLSFSYDVPLRFTYINGVLAFKLDAQNAHGSVGLFNISGLAERLTASLGNALDRVSFNVNNYVPNFVSAFGPSITRVDLILKENGVSLHIAASAKFTGAAGDRLLADATKDWSIDRVVRLFHNVPGPIM